MNRTRAVLSLFFAVMATACVKPVPPVFDDPIPMSSPAVGASLGPRLSTGEDNRVLLSWMQRADKGATLNFSMLDRDRWQDPIAVVSDAAMFVNWADLPSITHVSGDHFVAHWLSYSANRTYSYDVLVAQSTDGGASWSAAFRPHTDGTESEHGFVSLFVGDNDETGLIWLDGRKTINEPGDDPHTSGMTLRAAFVNKDGSISREQLIDELICDCCQTDVAVSNRGPVAVYRNRTVEEIRDIYIARFVDGEWTQGEAFSNDGWEIAGCPVNGPAIAARGDLVAIAWFTAANDKPLVQLRLSKNGGGSFGDAIEIATGSVQGHVDVTVLDDVSVAVSWLQSDPSELYSVNVRSVTTDGSLGDVSTIGKTAVSRNVPQMLEHDGDLVFAWTDQVDDKTRLASVRVPILFAGP